MPFTHIDNFIQFPVLDRLADFSCKKFTVNFSQLKGEYAMREYASIKGTELAREIMTDLCNTQREEREAVERCFGNEKEADSFQEQERLVQLLNIKRMLTDEEFKAFCVVYC